MENFKKTTTTLVCSYCTGIYIFLKTTFHQVYLYLMKCTQMFTLDRVCRRQTKRLFLSQFAVCGTSLMNSYRALAVTPNKQALCGRLISLQYHRNDMTKSYNLIMKLETN